MAKKKAATKRRPRTRKKAVPDPAPPAELVEAAVTDRLGEHGLKLEPLRELLDQVKSQIESDIAPPAALFTAALNIQKEINRLGGPNVADTEDLAGAAAELELIRNYLEPLELGDPALPCSELVRLAVCKLAS